MPSIRLALFSVAAALPAQQLITTVYGTTPDGHLGSTVRAAGDVDLDGVPDFLVGAAPIGGAFFELRSGATHAVLATFTGQLDVTDIQPAGDLDGDGHPDFLVGENGGLVAFSGSSGARLWQVGAPVLYLRACGVADLDGDGRNDVAAFVRLSNNYYFWMLRGTNGSQIVSNGPHSGGTVGLSAIGDVTGDGSSEIVRLVSQQAQVWTTSPPGMLHGLVPGGLTGEAAAADMTGDGVAEVIACAQDTRIWSAATGALLRTLPQPTNGPHDFQNGDFTVLGDLDSDGVPDLARRDGYRDGTTVPFTRLYCLSGADGRVLGQWNNSPQFSSIDMAGIGDVDADGYGDLLLGDPSAANGAGGWQIVSGKILASMQYLAVQCGGGPFFPQLGITRPVLGQPVVIVGRDCPPNAFGTVALSAQPTWPINLGVVGCDAWFDVTNWVMLHQPPPGAGWQATFALPGAPQLAGFAVALQAFYVPTNSALGYDLSNGVWARLGF
jgi:hypothetical protein